MDKQSEAVYNSLLNDNKLLPLSSFKSQKFSKYNLFPHAQSLPSFFDNNLKSDGRVVKYLKGPEGPLRAFYYQLLKLGFEIENSNADYSSIIKNIIFDPSLASYSTSPISGKQYNISQYQRIIAEFMKIMESQVIPNAELTFSQYPIIDEAMLTLLQLILQKSQLQPYRKIQNLSELIERLCQIFGITLEIYDNCFSFEQSDVFLYVQSPNSYYLAFLSEMAEVESFEKTSESPLQVQYKQQLSSLSYVDKKDEPRQANVYRDMRLSAGNKGTRARITNSKSPKQSKSNYGSSSFGVYTSKSRFHNQYNDYQLNEMNRSIKSKEQLEDKEHGYHKNVFQSSSSIPANNRFKNYTNQKEGQSFSNQNELSSSPQVSDIVEKNQNNQPREQNIIEGSQENIKQEQINTFNLNEHHHQELALQNNYQSEYRQYHQNIGANHHQGQYQKRSKNLMLNPVLDNVQTFKSISDGAQQNLQMLKNMPDNFSRVEYRAQDFMRNNIIQTLDPKSIKKSQRASITLKQKIFAYQFKSHKFQKMNQKQTIISLNQNLQIKTTKDISTNIIDHKAGQSLINTAETANTLVIQSTSNSNKFEKQKQFSPQKKLNKIQVYENKYNIEKQKYAYKIQAEKQIEMNFYNPKLNSNKQYSYGVGSDLYKAPNLSKFQISKQQTLGTYYRQFSDTKVMEAMIQPYSSKVRRTRQKFKGIRSKNFRGFY